MSKSILIISSSIREGRMSPRVVLFLQTQLKAAGYKDVEVADLDQLNFPLFTERKKFLKKVPRSLTAFTRQVEQADGIIIVAPEYNGGYPAALKNAIDVLYEEWYRKPIGIVSVSSGQFGGSQVQMQLAGVLWKMRALLVPSKMNIAFVEKEFKANGKTSNPINEKAAKVFIQEFGWTMNLQEC